MIPPCGFRMTEGTTPGFCDPLQGAPVVLHLPNKTNLAINGGPVLYIYISRCVYIYCIYICYIQYGCVSTFRDNQNFHGSSHIGDPWLPHGWPQIWLGHPACFWSFHWYDTYYNIYIFYYILLCYVILYYIILYYIYIYHIIYLYIYIYSHEYSRSILTKSN